MKKHWLRGVLLGVSVALLLSGGVALAQAQMSMTLDQACLPCWPGVWGPEALPDLTDEYILHISLSGLDPTLTLCSWADVPGYGESGECTSVPVGKDTYLWTMAGSCQVQQLCAWVGKPSEMPVICFEPVEFGTVSFEMWQTAVGAALILNGPVSGSVTYAEVCEVEFVPEPGSMILLGSGLAGLAGYASLRWRTRK